MKSLTDKDPEMLWNDLKDFFEQEYSADRMYLVVQAILPAGKDLQEIQQWVTESFSIIPNKEYGKQNFAKIDPTSGAPQLPFDDKLDEMLVQDSISD